MLMMHFTEPSCIFRQFPGDMSFCCGNLHITENFAHNFFIFIDASTEIC